MTSAFVKFEHGAFFIDTTALRKSGIPVGRTLMDGIYVEVVLDHVKPTKLDGKVIYAWSQPGRWRNDSMSIVVELPNIIHFEWQDNKTLDSYSFEKTETGYEARSTLFWFEGAAVAESDKNWEPTDLCDEEMKTLDFVLAKALAESK